MKIDVQHLHEQLCRITEEQCDITKEQLCSKTRKREIVTMRQIHMGILREYTKASQSAIGKLYGGKDHATVLHAEKHHKERLKPKFDAHYRQTYDLIAPYVDHIIASMKAGIIHYLSLNVSHLPVETLRKVADTLFFAGEIDMAETLSNFADMKAEQARLMQSLENPS